jgi:hypothetical protein
MDDLELTNTLQNSERMFKTRIRAWRVDKNNKEEEMLAMVRKLKEREAQGKKSLFMVRGREITEADIYHYLGRKGIRWTDIQPDDDSNIWDRSEIICSTPAASPRIRPATLIMEGSFADQIPKNISPLQVDTSSSNFLRSIYDYYSTMFVSGCWGTLDQVNVQFPVLQFGGEFLKYHNLLALGKSAEAYELLNTTFGTISGLLRAGHPRLLIYLLESIAFSRSVGHHDVARRLVDCFTFTSSKVLGAFHPITVFASSLRQNDSTVLDGFVEIGLQCMTEQFLMHMGPAHAETMGLLLTSSAILKHQKSYYMASARLEQLLTLYEQAFGPLSMQASHALADHAVVKTEMGDFGEAEVLMIQAMRRAVAVQDANERVESQIRCLMNLSILRKAQGDIPQMIYNLELALRTGEGMLDDEHWMMRHVTALLASAPATSSPPSVSSLSLSSPPILTPESATSE